MTQALYISISPPSGAKTVDSFWVLDLRAGEGPSDREEKFQKLVDDSALDPFYPMWPASRYNGMNGLSVSSDGARIAWPSINEAGRNMYLLKTDTVPGDQGERLLQSSFGGSARAVDFRHTDDLIALGVSGTTGIYLYTKDGTRVFSPNFAIAGTPDVVAVKFSPSGGVLAAVLYSSLRFYDMDTGAQIPTSGLSSDIDGSKPQMSFSPDGQWLALADNSFGAFNRRLVRFVAGTWTNTVLASFDVNATFAPAFSPDSTEVILPGRQSEDKEIALYQGLGGTITRTFVVLTAARGPYIQAVYWSSDGENIFVISQNYGPNTVYLDVLDATDYTVVTDHPLSSGWSWPGTFDVAAFAPAPSFLGAGAGGVLGSDGNPVEATVRLYDRSSGELLGSAETAANGAYGFSRFAPWGPGFEYDMVFLDGDVPPRNDLIIRIQT